ncbi:MAG: cell wall-binding repeat-containing protein [Coriobacteriia bacterium]
MRHLYIRHAVLAVVLVVLLLGGTASGLELPMPSVDWTPIGLSISPTIDEDSAAIDGNLVAWEYADQIQVRNLSSGVTRFIPNSGGMQADPDISGDRVVFMDNGSGNWDIKMYRWSTNAVTEVRATAASEVLPRIDGNWVVWWDDTDRDVWGRNYDMGGATATQLTVGHASVLYDVDDGRLAVSIPGDVVHVRNLSPLGDFRQVHDFGETVYSIEMHGNRIAVETVDGVSDHDIVICDITDGTVSDVATNDTRQRAPSIFHTGVAWFEYDLVETSSEIGYGFPGITFVATPSFGGVESDRYPSIYGHRIAYQRDAGGDLDVMLATSDTKLQSRSQGINRYGTAAATSEAYFKSADNVVLCNGRNFPDALSAAPLAKALDAPLLLTEATVLPPETAAEIARLGPSKIWVVGGSSVVSSAVFNQLLATYDMERVSGANRYETSAAVARKLETILGPSAVSRAFFANGENYPDALAVGPVAGAANGPVMLVLTDSVPASIADAVDDLDITIGYVVGGTSVVSPTADTALRSLITANGGIGTITERWAGADRYATAAVVAQKGLDYRWVDLDTVGFAIGTNFPDALGSGAALGSYGSVLLLTHGTVLSPPTAAFLDAHPYQIGRVNAFGGADVLSSTVYNAILAKIL